MSVAGRAVRPFNGRIACMDCYRRFILDSSRSFTTSSRCQEEATQTSSPANTLGPNLVATPQQERKLIRDTKIQPIGSRRRRAALRLSQQVPFEHLPYQCFQEARRILIEDRAEKLREIETQRARIERLKSSSVPPQNELHKERRLASMTTTLEQLKIHADINDPLVKRRFEDGQGDMNKPIYRYLADRKWRSYDRKVLMQRLHQMSIVPDILPTIDPTAAVDLAFGRRAVKAGEIVDSRVSEIPARLNIQVHDKGERLVTVVVVNPDVPDVAKDGFNYRCHFMACNIKISPTSVRVPLDRVAAEQLVLPWLPAYTQKGAPYQRMAVFVLAQQSDQVIDTHALRDTTQRQGFILRSLVDRHKLKPIGAHLFRSEWDEGTAGVMQRAGIPGHDVEFKRKKIEPLPYKKLPGSRYR